MSVLSVARPVALFSTEDAKRVVDEFRNGVECFLSDKDPDYFNLKRLINSLGSSKELQSVVDLRSAFAHRVAEFIKADKFGWSTFFTLLGPSKEDFSSVVNFTYERKFPHLEAGLDEMSVYLKHAFLKGWSSVFENLLDRLCNGSEINALNSNHKMELLSHLCQTLPPSKDKDFSLKLAAAIHHITDAESCENQCEAIRLLGQLAKRQGILRFVCGADMFKFSLAKAHNGKQNEVVTALHELLFEGLEEGANKDKTVNPLMRLPAHPDCDSYGIGIG